MGVAKKGRGNNFQNCSTSSKVLYGCQLVISGEKSILARSATICKINTVWLPTTNRTSNNFFLRSIFLSSMSASIKKKVSQNRTKLQQKNKQQTNNKRPFFLPKINKVFLRPILQNLKGRSVLDNFFLKMILSTT